MNPWRSLALTLVLATVAAALGVWGGEHYGLARDHGPPGLHQMLHRKLRLTAPQRARIDALENAYAADRSAAMAEMRAANADLARAYQQGHAYTPQVQAAIDRFHRASGALERDTILHVIAMRSVLRSDQTDKFDGAVIRSLTRQGA